MLAIRNGNSYQEMTLQGTRIYNRNDYHSFKIAETADAGNTVIFETWNGKTHTLQLPNGITAKPGQILDVIVWTTNGIISGTKYLGIRESVAE